MLHISAAAGGTCNMLVDVWIGIILSSKHSVWQQTAADRSRPQQVAADSNRQQQTAANSSSRQQQAAADSSRQQQTGGQTILVTSPSRYLMCVICKLRIR